MRIYLAGPINGLSYDAVIERLEYKNIIREHYEVLSPMTGKEELRCELEFKGHGYDGVPVATNHAIYGRDMWMVKRSDIVFADLVGSERVSIGTVMEMAWASVLGKHVVLAMEPENIHTHSFVLEAADIVFPTADQALAYLITLAGKEPR